MSRSRYDADSTTVRTPFRPLPLRLANWLMGILDPAEPVAVDVLIDRARERTGLDDFGPPDVREPLDVLLRSIHEEARLHPVGRAIVHGRILAALEQRLRLQQLLRRHPEILRIDVSEPIVVTGLARSGTTLMQRLLAADPRRRALRTWEAMSPTPPAGPGPDLRPWLGHAAEYGVRFMAPAFFSIHPTEAEAPEEEVILLDFAFMSTVPEATMHVPTYAAWLETQDVRPAYALMRRMMQALSFQSGTSEWVLKTPHHLEFLDPLVDELPGARIIQTHRDPTTTIASLCSMIAHGRGVFSDLVDPEEVGEHWLRKVSRMLDSSLQSRDRLGEDRFVDVRYEGLIADPLATIASVYRRFGIPMTDAAWTAMARARQRHRAHRYGMHRYRLEDFGLTEARIREATAGYRQRFYGETSSSV